MTPDNATVRAFVAEIHAHAARACRDLERPGLLQLSKIGVDDKLFVAGRFRIGDVDGMADLAVAHAEAGSNVYVEPRTVREDIEPRKRGDLEDSRAVFALVIDRDTYSGKSGNQIFDPTICVETSPGSAHEWLVFETAVAPNQAKALGDLLRRASQADTNTGNPVQPYRVAGTPNFPNKKKKALGRVICPTTFASGGPLYSPGEVRDQLSRFAKPASEAAATPDNQPTGFVPDTVERLLSEVLPDGADRSARFAHAVKFAVESGMTMPDFEMLCRDNPQGAAGKYLIGRNDLSARIEELWLPHAAQTLERDRFGAALVAQLLGARGEPADDPDPVDLWATFDPPKLPLGLLPVTLEEFALSTGSLMGADAGGLAAAVLAVCAAAIPDKIQLQIKQHDSSWLESARIWVAEIGPPSTKKSPMIQQAVRPLARIDARLYREYAQALAKYEATPKDERGDKPKQVRVRLEDVTIEAAQEVFRDSPDGLLVFQDELSGWFGGMDKYSGRGASKDRGFWLQSFNGGHYVVNRIGRGASFIENLSACVLGGIQPDLIRKIAAETNNDGFLQRLFPIVLSPACASRDEPEGGTAEVYAELIERLHQLTPARVGGSGNVAHLSLWPLKFSEGAQAIRRELERKHLEMMRIETVNRKLAAHIGKLDGLFARLCIVWHCVDHAHDEFGLPPIVTENTAHRVGEFMRRFLLPHAIAFYCGVLGFSEEHDAISAVAAYILAHPEIEEITFRDIQRGDRTLRSMTRQQAQEVLERLEYFGWLVPAQRPRNGTTPRWKVNARVHELFHERGLREAERRRQAREEIAKLAGRGM